MDHKEAVKLATEIKKTLLMGFETRSTFIELCDYVTAPRPDPWQATQPVPNTPERLREFIFDNQFTEDVRVKYLLGMCHAAIGELLAEVAKAKAAGVKTFTGERPALPTPPAKPEQLCAILSANKLTDDPYLRDLLDQCHGAMSSMDGGEIQMLVDILRQVRRAAEGKKPPSYHPLVSQVIDLYQRANAPKSDPWRAAHPIPDDPEQLCAFILNNHLTDDDRMENLLIRCHSKIRMLLGHNKELISEQTKVEEALGVGWWAGPDAPPDLLHESAKRIRGELARIRAAALPEQVAAVAQQISDAKGQWDDGCGKGINEVFRSCDTLLDAVRVLVSKEEAAKTCAIKAVDLLQREIAASLTPALIEQAVKLGTRGNGLSATASPGPWIAERGLVHMAGFKAPEIADCAMRLEKTKGRYNDADFIAEARSVVPEMCELLLCIAKKAGEGRVLPEEVAELIAAIDGPSPEEAAVQAKPAMDERADAYARMAGEQQREIERLSGELTAAKKHAAEAEERAAHNETRAVEEGHRFIAAERKYAELSVLIDQRLASPKENGTRLDLLNIGRMIDEAALLVTLCSGGPWSFVEKGNPKGNSIVFDAVGRPVAMILEPLLGSVETARYNGRFISASRALVVHLVGMCRTLLAESNFIRETNATLSALDRDNGQKIAAATEELRLLRDQLDEARTTIAIKEKELADLRAGLEGYQRRTHLQQSRTAAANRLWQRDTGRHDTIPDLGDLVAWLLKRAGSAEKKLAAAVEQQKMTDSRIDELASGIRAYRELADGRADDIREDCWWTRAAVAWEKEHGGRVSSDADATRDTSAPGDRRDTILQGTIKRLEAEIAGWRQDAGERWQRIIITERERDEARGEVAELRRQLTSGRQSTVDADKLYLVQDSRTYVGNDVSWWGPKSGGYTCQIDEAGLYDEHFVKGLQETDIIYRAADIYPLATRVVDIQRIQSAGVKPVTFPKDPAR